MEKDKDKTVVVFRQWRDDGSIIALFPEEPASALDPATCMSYEHIGQHGAACPCVVRGKTVPAQPEEYHRLYEELVSIGYSLEIRERMSFKMHQKRVEALRKWRETTA